MLTQSNRDRSVALASLTSRVRRLLVATAGAALLLGAPAVGQGPPAADDGVPDRLVSVSFGGDQLLMGLAAPEQIASLSRWSVDPDLSYFADPAQRYRHDAHNAESVIRLDPDLVLVDATTPTATRNMLIRLGYRVYNIAPVSTVDQSMAQVVAVATVLGHANQGVILSEFIATARERARRENWGVTAAYYHRGGFVAGDGALLTDILRIVGLNNVAGAAMRGTEGYLSLEALVASPPDYLIVANAYPVARDQGLALLTHPALAALFPPERRIELPERLTNCGGPSLPEAFRLLLSEFQRVTPR